MLLWLLPLPRCSRFCCPEEPPPPEQASDAGKALTDRARVPVETTRRPTRASCEACDRDPREDGDDFACWHHSTAHNCHIPDTFGEATLRASFGTMPPPSAARFALTARTNGNSHTNRPARPSRAEIGQCLGSCRAVRCCSSCLLKPFVRRTPSRSTTVEPKSSNTDHGLRPAVPAAHATRECMLKKGILTKQIVNCAYLVWLIWCFFRKC